MTTEERAKAIASMIAVASSHPLLPNEIKVGLAAMAEELRELRTTLVALSLATRCVELLSRPK